jgi:hypothetical protein
MVLEKNANFFAENWKKSQKIVIIASTPGRLVDWETAACVYLRFLMPRDRDAI